MKLGIKPTVDIVFKKLLGSEEHIGLTLSFLNAVLERAGRPKAASLAILNPFRPGEFRGDKDCVLDIRARDQEGREFQIEVQVKTNAALTRRMLHYWATCYLSQLPKGREYLDHSPVISVWLIEEPLFRDGAFFHAFQPIDPATRRLLSEDFLVITLELSAWEETFGIAPATSTQTASLEGSLENWLYFFSKGEDLDPDDPGPNVRGAEFQEAMEIMRTFTKSEAARYAYFKRLDYQRDRMSSEREEREKGLAEGLIRGRAEGKAEGIAEGEQAKALETARRLKARGLAIEIIAESTGLSRDEVETLG
ncbi:MAG: Rpn family recombination-promoting nuclease/putative transposase [Spirochaetaceae bacterium]|nr:Rpn family recombination-promoting nuclease/putative transposase [Spirochaetaceae bacterium]